MKKVNFFGTKTALLIAVFVFILQSCKKEIIIDAAPVEEDRISFLQQEVASSMGIPADKVIYRETEKIFVVEDDGFITLEDAKTRFAVSGTFNPGEANGATQKRSPYQILPWKVNTIKIYAKNTVPAVWIMALDAAIKNWNATGSKVFMRRVTSPNGATTQVHTFYSASGTIALSAYPDNWGNPGNKIRINTFQNSLAYLKKVFAITHELGHTLGLSHTNGTYGQLIPGTPVSDTRSIMNSVCLNWAGFSAYDYKAIRKVYPK